MRPRLLTAILRRVASADPSADLLARFRANRDDAAFAELVRRHARLVWGVCRNLLPAEADAEDAFQATFLALARSAHKLRDDRAVPGWLHATAVRVCLQSRRAAGRRQRHEQRAASPEASAPVADSRWADVLAAVHEEVNRLPTPLRTAFVACCLEGRGQSEAAAFLGWKLGTLSGRLTRAKQTILDRLDRRGLVPAVGLAAVSATSNAPARAVTAAVRVMHGSGSATVLELARRATGGTMSAKMWAAAVVATAIGIGGGSAWLSRTEAQAPATKPAKPAADNGGAGQATGTYPPPEPGRIVWEYTAVAVPANDMRKDRLASVLNGVGRQGWELCGSESLADGDNRLGLHLILKRPLVSGEPPRAVASPASPPLPAAKPRKTSILSSGPVSAGEAAKALAVALARGGEPAAVAPVEGAGAVVVTGTADELDAAEALIRQLAELVRKKQLIEQIEKERERERKAREEQLRKP